MNNRERIVRTLQCRQTDRAPFCMWLGFSPWETTLERWKEESGISDLDINEYFGFEPYFQVVDADYGPLPHFEEKVIDENEQYIVKTDFRGLTMRCNIHSNSIPEFFGYPINCQKDWQIYKQERLQPCLNERLKKFDEFAKTAKTLDAPIQAGIFPWGVFGSIRDLMGVERLLFAFYDEPELLRDIMETYVTLWIGLYEKIANVVNIDRIHIWEDMSGKQGSLISMEMIEEFMMPQYDRIADFCRRRNVPVFSVDSDGCVDQLVPTMMNHGVNAFMPFEVQAGCDIEQYRQLYPELSLQSHYRHDGYYAS